jgi:hypothetical protein
MTEYDDFSTALAESGRPAEARIAGAFFAAGVPVHWIDKGSKGDIEVFVDGWWQTIEVKNEDNYASSPNICIEIFQGKRDRSPSGISVSESHVYVHTMGDVVICFRTQQMRLFVKSGPYELKSFGDNGNEGFLVPINDIADEPWCEKTATDDLPESRVLKW